MILEAVLNLGKIMFVSKLFYTILFLFPLVLLLLISHRLDQLQKEITEKKLDLAKIDFSKYNHFSDFYPSKIRKELIASEYSENSIKMIMEYYNQLFKTLVFYIIAIVLYSASVIVGLIYGICSLHKWNMQESAYFVAATIWGLYFSYVLLSPILGLRELEFKVVRNLTDSIYKICRRIVKMSICGSISFIILFLYVLCINDRIKPSPYTLNKQLEIFLWVLALFIYQYGGLKIIAWGGKKIIPFFCSKPILCSKFPFLLDYIQKYQEGDILYLFFKNYTYLVMALVTAFTVHDSTLSSSSLVLAINILFLLDSFFTQDNEINKILKQKEK